MQVRVSVVTPSYNGWPLTRLCVASVADQGVALEHLVQDAGSTDGTTEALAEDLRVKLFVERDQGMYDALNRGFHRAGGDVLAWLNCDEQYLAGALPAVLKLFEGRPEVDVVFGDVVLVDRQGNYVSHRRMQVPLKHHTWTCHLSTLSCGTFFRRGLLERGFRFDESYRAAGDGEWMVRLLRAGVRMAVLGAFTSAFTLTGSNLGGSPQARDENYRLRRSAPVAARLLRPGIVLHHRLRRWLGGMYSRTPFEFEIFTQASPDRREKRRVTDPQPRGTGAPALQGQPPSLI